MKKPFVLTLVVVLVLSLLPVETAKGEFSGNCPTENRYYEFTPPDYRIVGNTVTFDYPVTFCVKAGNYNSGKITGTTFTVNWYNKGNQTPDISSVAVYEVPNAVTLFYFTSQIKKNYTLLKWETAEEINNLGFNIYRSAGIKGKKIKVNRIMIRAYLEEMLIGHTYSYKVNRRNKQDVYWLEAVDIFGYSKWYQAEKLPLTK